MSGIVAKPAALALLFLLAASAQALTERQSADIEVCHKREPRLNALRKTSREAGLKSARAAQGEYTDRYFAALETHRSHPYHKALVQCLTRYYTERNRREGR